MLIKETIRIILFSLIHLTYLHAQDHGGSALKSPAIPVEIFMGNHAVNVQLVVSKHFNEKSKWGYFNVTSFNGDYKNDLTKNEFFTQLRTF
ncbi:hypothetical protein [Emticicia sp.]|uniref:hypothetical protein n=1 Tax=Emticicia sp. TaxID=1930953 RepID=UPI003752513A